MLLRTLATGGGGIANYGKCCNSVTSVGTHLQQ